MRRMIIGCVLALGCGCAFIKPTTEVRFNGRTGEFRILDSKDNDLDLSGLEMSRATEADGSSSFSLKAPKATLRNSASDVIKENVQQMLAFAEQQRAAAEFMRVTMDGLGNIADSLMPFASVGRANSQVDSGQLRQAQMMIQQLRTMIDEYKRAQSQPG